MEYKGLSPSLQMLSTRTCNCLAGAGLLTDDLLCAKTSKQLMKLRNFGRACLREVERYLTARGRQLADTPIPTSIKSDFPRHAAAVARYAKYPDSGLGTLKAIRYCALGLASEADSIANKMMRGIDEQLTDDDRKAMYTGLGNVLWYFFRCCAELGFDPEKVATENIDKLAQIASFAMERERVSAITYALSPMISERKFPLTPRQQAVLTCLSKFKYKPTAKELSDDMGLRLAQMINPLSELERKGYIVRHIETPSSRMPITEERKKKLHSLAQALPVQKTECTQTIPKPTIKSKDKTKTRVSTRSIAAELMSIFEKGPDDEYQGEDDPGDSRNGEEVVRGAGQEQAD